MAKKTKTKKVTPKTVYLVKWGDYSEDPIEEFSDLEKAKKKVNELIIDNGENAQYVRIYKVLALYRPEIAFVEL